jgi:CheY-like chemotaxis protein
MNAENQTQAVILMVDDNTINLQLLHETLDGQGCRLLAASSGEEALRIARKAQPDLILLDIMMPGIDGYETCARLKSDEEEFYVRVGPGSRRLSASEVVAYVTNRRTAS